MGRQRMAVSVATFVSRTIQPPTVTGNRPHLPKQKLSNSYHHIYFPSTLGSQIPGSPGRIEGGGGVRIGD